jgi:hypothetical protein
MAWVQEGHCGWYQVVQFEAERGIWSGRFADVLPPDCCGSSDVIRASKVMEEVGQ